MRHLRPYLAVLAIAAITTACSAAPGSSSGGESSQAAGESQGGGASQPAASTGGGGGGGGGGANGSVTYEITGDYQASGELPFLAGGISLWIESSGGWVANFANDADAVILINTQAAEGTPGQIFTYGDGSVILTAISTVEAGNSCTFNLTKNDSSGLSGDLHCDSAIASDVNSGAQMNVQVTAHWDAHP